MIVIDDFIPKSFQDSIEHTHIHEMTFTYGPYDDKRYFSSSDLPEGYKPTVLFVHSLYENRGQNPPLQSIFFDKICNPLLLQFINYFNTNQFILGRIKSNYNHQQDFNYINTPHSDVDGESDFISALYYVTDSDGDTIFYDYFCAIDEKINKNKFFESNVTRLSPKKGRLVVFKSNQMHASSFPVVSNNRFVVNFVLSIPNFKQKFLS